MHQIGITVIAYNIPQDVINRFTSNIQNESRPKLSYKIEIITDPNDALYEHTDGHKYMCRAKGLNRGILKLADICEVIVCTDIDLIYPPGVFERTYEECMNNNWVWGVCRDISSKKINPRRWNEWLNLPLREVGKGGFNGMHTQMWQHVGGWNENLYGWGGEDDDFHHRALHKKINRIRMTEFAIMHVNHPRRTRERGLKNLELAKRMGVHRYTTNWLTGESMDNVPFTGVNHDR